MPAKKPKKRQQAIRLRKQGKSYNEIADEISVAKSSVSKWCQEVTLPPKAKKALQEKITAGQKALNKLNEKRHKSAQREHEKIKTEAAKKINSLSNFELLLIGAALYWGEGYKSKKGSNFIELANSDPQLIAIFLRFLREILEVPEKKIRVKVYTHPNIKNKSAIQFWSKTTQIPEDSFQATQKVSTSSKKRRSSNTLPYGTAHIRVYDYEKYFKIKGWIEGLKNKAYRSNTNTKN